MTKFLTINPVKTENKKTVFNKVLNHYLEIEEAIVHPKDYDNVLFMGHDIDYGDVFKAWDDDSEDNFIIAFGTKGDEFNS